VINIFYVGGLSGFNIRKQNAAKGRSAAGTPAASVVTGKDYCIKDDISKVNTEGCPTPSSSSDTKSSLLQSSSSGTKSSGKPDAKQNLKDGQRNTDTLAGDDFPHRDENTKNVVGSSSGTNPKGVQKTIGRGCGIGLHAAIMVATSILFGGFNL